MNNNLLVWLRSLTEDAHSTRQIDKAQLINAWERTASAGSLVRTYGITKLTPITKGEIERLLRMRPPRWKDARALLDELVNHSSKQEVLRSWYRALRPVLYKRRLEESLVTWHMRDSHREHPDGVEDRLHRWRPVESETCRCCKAINVHAAWANLRVHCRTIRHVSALLGVIELDLKRDVRTRRKQAHHDVDAILRARRDRAIGGDEIAQAQLRDAPSRWQLEAQAFDYGFDLLIAKVRLDDQ